jgi:predicted NodU family carbamoyl transferase
MRVLGIPAYYHDSAAALVSDGEVVVAAHEERFSRKKFDESFPHQAIGYCLETAGARLRDINNVVSTTSRSSSSSGSLGNLSCSRGMVRQFAKWALADFPTLRDDHDRTTRSTSRIT